MTRNGTELVIESLALPVIRLINASAASHGYVPGPIPAGRWRGVVGKAKILESPARYRLEVTLRTKPTLAAVPRSEYVAARSRQNETRYYAGDLHVHSHESGDATATLDENIALAQKRGLDWLEISDHNTVTQLDFFNEAHENHPDFLLVPGIEVTTYAGHANAIGATKFVNQRVGQPGITIDSIVDAVHAQGAIFSINHPMSARSASGAHGNTTSTSPRSAASRSVRSESKRGRRSSASRPSRFGTRSSTRA